MKTNALMAAFACVALLGSTARGQESSKDEKVLEEARQHAARAKVHYDLGEFKEAADEYTIVYRLRPIPALLFNIAQSYRQAGMYEKARQFYKAYLRESPEAKNRGVIEQAIREMDELLAKEKKTKETPPNGVKEPVGPPQAEARLSLPTPTPGVTPKPVEPTAKPVEPPAKPVEVAEKPTPKPATVVPTASTTATTPSAKPPITVAMTTPPASKYSTTTAARPERHRTWTWVAAGATVAALAAGGVFGYQTINSGSSSDAQKANILYGVGGALAAATAALFILEF